RRWLPVAWFWSNEQFDEPFLVNSRLAYQATPVFPGLPREVFAYDPLDDNARRRALRGVKQHLAPLLAALRARLLRAGLDKKARHYEKRALLGILNMLMRQRRTYDGYLLADNHTINQFQMLAAAGRSLRQLAVNEPPRAARGLCEFAGEFANSLTRRMRRLVPAGELPLLPSLVIIEATRALAPGTPVEAHLILRQNDREVVLRKS
ncbi:MAG TPA: hypothetical protein VMS96_13370, partial [Terriglobales bacterium]|nr:hypothetical protein [Terriglobales bacterium]